MKNRFVFTLIMVLLLFCTNAFSQDKQGNNPPPLKELIKKTSDREAQQPVHVFSPKNKLEKDKRDFKSADKQQPLKQKPETTPKSKISGKNVTYVELKQADVWLANDTLYHDAQVIIGNVMFQHDSVHLFCDTAYFYRETNSFEAFGNVVIEQGDTLFVYGDELYYDGNSKLAKLRNNVLMDNLSATLRTDYLDYDRAKNVGYYFNGGIIEDTLNTLSSEKGYYFPTTKTADFQTDVELINPDFTINSDTLKYNVETKVASILGPTDIIYDKETHIYSEYGWYNTDNEQCKLLLNSWIQHNSGKKLTADTIFYDKKNGKGEGFSNVELRDTANKVVLYGNYGYYIEKGEIGLVTDSAMMVEYSTKDTLFLHADTLFTKAESVSDTMLLSSENIIAFDTNLARNDTILAENDTIMPKNDIVLSKNDSITNKKDSTYKIFIGYPNVRLFRNDIQGICDSSYYSTRDSILQLMKRPVAWSGERQLSGDTIKIFSKNGNADRAEIYNRSFVCEKVEDKYFNQLSGKNMVGYIFNHKLKKVDVKGNAETLYYPQEDDKNITCQMKMVSSLIFIHFNDTAGIERLSFQPKPSGKGLPVSYITDDLLYLDNFYWQIGKKPISKFDIFRNSYEIAASQNDSTANVQNNQNRKKTTRRDDAEQVEDKIAKGKKQTTSSDSRRPSGFDNPSQGTAQRPTGRSTVGGGLKIKR